MGWFGQPGNPGINEGLGRYLAHSTLRASVATSRRGALVIITSSLAGSWLVIFMAGGADSMVPHLYYVPILFAAARFGPVAALVVACIAGILAGPLTYVDVAQATTQDPARWLTRTGYFIGIGQLMAWLVGPSLIPITEEIRRLRKEREIRKGLANGEFFLQYQPVYSLADDSYPVVEALIRWQHPVQGHQSPAGFMAAAEECHLIHEITDFVLDEACRQASQWRKLAWARNQTPWAVAVNISGRNLELPDLATRVRKTLERHDLPPELLHIEVTESALALENSAFQLRQLKKLGICLAIDDFGTGYSSLSYLNRFPADTLKIDRSLIATLSPDKSSQALARGMILLARSMGMTTVAEGIENGTQLKVGRALEFDYAQGYHLSRPMDAGDIPAFLLADELPPEQSEKRDRL